MKPETQKINDWMNTQEYRDGSDPTTIGANENQRQFMQTRLWKAFTAGMDAGKQIERERIVEVVRELVKP